VLYFFAEHGIENLAFLTITFRHPIWRVQEAQRRYNSLATNVLKSRYPAWITVLERHESGAIHFHLLIAIGRDIRMGIDFAAIRNGDYRSANPALRGEWGFWRRVAKRYHLGRVELLPIKTNGVAVGRYLSKLLREQAEKRNAADKGAHLVRYSAGAKVVSSQFGWGFGARSWLWRRKLELFARALGCNSENYGARFGAWFGPRWILRVGLLIESIRLPVYPSARHFIIDFGLEALPPWRSPNSREHIFIDESVAEASLGAAVRVALDNQDR